MIPDRDEGVEVERLHASTKEDLPARESFLARCCDYWGCEGWLA
jgi:hypothetical protein